MKIVKRYGCTAASFTVDGIPYDDLTSEQVQKLEDAIFAAIRKEIADGSSSHYDLIDSVYSNEVTHSESCEQCGDSVCTTKWDI
jgi:hypothetical protein